MWATFCESYSPRATAGQNTGPPGLNSSELQQSTGSFGKTKT